MIASKTMVDGLRDEFHINKWARLIKWDFDGYYWDSYVDNHETSYRYYKMWHVYDSFT